MPIPVTVIPLPATPMVTAGGTTSFCKGGSVTLKSDSATAYIWSNGTKSRTLTSDTAGTFTVRTVNAGGCTSAVSVATVVTVNALPTTPVITVTGSTNICSGDSVKLSGPVGLTTYLWSNGARGSSINVSAAGSYTLRTTSAAGCTSLASPAIVVTVAASPATPTVSYVPPAIQLQPPLLHLPIFGITTIP